MLPTLDDIEAAARLIRPVIPPTPQYVWPLLSERLGLTVWLKHENHTPAGAFKVRGGLVYFADLVRPAKVTEVIAATRGNHGQSIAIAAARHGMTATIVVPRGNSLEKNAAMRAQGGQLIEHGADFQESLEYATTLAHERGAHMVPSYHPLLVRGVATYGAELFRAAPDLDCVYVPIGMGSGTCATIAARNALSPQTKVIGVVSAHANAYALSFAGHRVIESPVSTLLADGMACRTPRPDALEVICQYADHVVEVTDAEVAGAMRLLHECTHNCAEGAGAAAIAAIVQERQQLQGKKVAAILTGGNVDAAVFARVLAGETFAIA